MSATMAVLIGIGIGFILNFPPKKIQYILTFALALFVILSFAFLSDANFNILGNWDWATTIFSFLGYIFGYVIAYASKSLLKVGWR
jgi:hypothetical protein